MTKELGGLPMHSPSRVPHRRRRGAVLVLVAVALVGLMGIAAMAVDFARMFAFKSQLKVLADATALSAAEDLGITDQATAVTRARALNASNLVENSVIPPGDIVIEPCRWNGTNCDVASATWNNASAVRSTVTYVAAYSLARVFGAATTTLREQSVASIGSVTNSDCVKPFTISVESLIMRVRPTFNYLTDPLELTAEDIAKLTAAGNQGTFNLATAATNVPGSFGFVLGKDFTGSINATTMGPYIIGTSCVRVTGGDTLRAVTGQDDYNSNSAQSAWKQLCPQPSGTANNAGTWTCVAPVDIKMPVYSSGIRSGNTGRYIVAYITGFRLTGVTLGNTGSITGSILSIAASNQEGGFQPGFGPIRSRGVALIK